MCVWGGGVYCILYKPCNASSLADLLCGSAPSHPLVSTSGRDADYASFCSLLPWSGYGTRLTTVHVSGQLNPNKMGIGEKSLTFIQNDFTP